MVYGVQCIVYSVQCIVLIFFCYILCAERFLFSFPEFISCTFPAHRSVISRWRLFPNIHLYPVRHDEECRLIAFFYSSSYITSINSYQISHSLSSNISILFHQFNNFLGRFLGGRSHGQSSVGGDYLPMTTLIRADTAKKTFGFEFLHIPKDSVLRQS